MSTLSDKVASLRTSQDWTLQHLSDLTGISVSHLSAIEHGTRPNPSFQNVVRLAEAFQVPVTYFLEPDTKQPETLKRDRIAETPHVFKHQRDFDHFDAATRRFLADKSAIPYVAFARQLAEQAPQDPVALLDTLTHFLKRQRHSVD